jgi:16S rRNA (guanine527-N7)-methyltransferase
VQGYLELLRKWSPAVHLTAVRDEKELLRLHIVESLWAAAQLPAEASPLVDLGSGAGFPGLFIKLYRPDWEITLVEQNLKKSVFLEEVARRLNLNLRVFRVRGEHFADWSQVSTVTMRALRPSRSLRELLKMHRVRLAYLGGRVGGEAPGWTLLSQTRYPLSRERWLRLWDARTLVSRET